MRAPDTVQRHRDLFQAPRHDIKLGHSVNGCYCYLWRVKDVVTCNGWYDELAALSAANRQRVEANTSVLEISVPMREYRAPAGRSALAFAARFPTAVAGQGVGDK